jgi:hypothetical protein
MMHTAIVLALSPIVSGMLAFLAAYFLAAYRVATVENAPFVPEYTASESAEWIADLSLSLDVDAEWIALADAPEASPRSAAAAYVASAKRGIAAAAGRIRKHVAEAITVDPVAPLSSGKLVSDRATFLASVRLGIAQATARRTLQATLTIGINREWCEAYAAPVDCFTYAPEENVIQTLGTLALLAHHNADATESALAWQLQSDAFIAELSAPSEDCEINDQPVQPLVTVAA